MLSVKKSHIWNHCWRYAKWLVKRKKEKKKKTLKKPTHPLTPTQQNVAATASREKVNRTAATPNMLGKRSCNLIPVQVPTVPLLLSPQSQFWPHHHPSPTSPHFLPVTPPSSMPEPYQTFSSNSGALRWAIGSSLWLEMSSAEKPQEKNQWCGRYGSHSWTAAAVSPQ